MRYILVWLTFLFLSFPVYPATDSPPVVIHAITRLIPRFQPRFAELRSGDLLILDLDNTVFREQQLLGTDEWYEHALNQLTQKGMSRKQASQHLGPVNKAIKSVSKMRLMEEGLPEVLRELQSRRIHVLGLTSRHPQLSETTILHLKELGIDFHVSGFPEVSAQSVPGLHNAFLFTNGIAFTDGAPKGMVLRFLLDEAKVRPQQVIAVDDRIHHIHSFVESLLDMGIGGHVVHYLKVREEPMFAPAIADLQHSVFNASGHLLSDEQAQKLLECQASLTGQF